MESKHEEIDNLIKRRLLALEGGSNENPERKRLNVLHEAICDENETIFCKLGIDMAKKVLMSIGIKEEEWFGTYIALREEEEKKRYILMDMGEEIQIKEEER